MNTLFTRRSFLAYLSAFSLQHALPEEAAAEKSRVLAQGTDSDTDNNLTHYVNVFVGTGGHGHTYPGATVPFGAVQLSPDTNNIGWDWCSGYHYSDSSIMGFSHTHLSGTGVGDMLDVLVMPGTGAVKLNSGSRDQPESGYRSRFSHADEKAEPGFYSVLLRDPKVHAELTATQRAGFHRYTFLGNDPRHVIVDLSHRYNDAPGGLLSSEMHIVDSYTVTGGRRVARWAAGREIYFAMRFAQPFTQAQLYSNDEPLNRENARTDGTSLKCILHFGTPVDNAPLLVKVGISGINAEGALRNLDAEIADWDFERVRKAARSSWQDELSRIRIDTTDAKTREIFYTSLYHMMLSPTLFDDVDGRYRVCVGKHTFLLAIATTTAPSLCGIPSARSIPPSPSSSGRGPAIWSTA